MAMYATLYLIPGVYSVNVPKNCTQLIIEAYGGGGAGAGITSSSGSKGGGAGGQYAKRTISNPTEGHVISVTVGDLKNGTYGNAGAGNDSYVSVNSIEQCRAKGGAGAIDEIAGAGSDVGGVGDIVRRGGYGADATQEVGSGGGGGGGGTISIGAGATNINGGSGGGGEAGYGGDGWAEDLSDHPGHGGNQAGGGGSGAFRNSSGSSVGGDGAAGCVKLTYTVVSKSNHFFVLY